MREQENEFVETGVASPFQNFQNVGNEHDCRKEI